MQGKEDQERSLGGRERDKGEMRKGTLARRSIGEAL